jgi:CheY-like chemotaxis protein
MTSDTQRGTILVVDDNIDIAGFTKLFLEKAGYSAVTAADGEEALRFYNEHQSSIMLLLTDVRMPNMNGFELADRVLKIDPRLPVLFMSGSGWGAHRGLECIAKPFRPAELIERVSRVLNAQAHQERTASAA